MLTQESFWWCIISLFPTSIPSPPPLSPSLISLMVSADVKHHIYLLHAVISTDIWASSPLSFPFCSWPVWCCCCCCCFLTQNTSTPNPTLSWFSLFVWSYKKPQNTRLPCGKLRRRCIWGEADHRFRSPELSVAMSPKSPFPNSSFPIDRFQSNSISQFTASRFHVWKSDAIVWYHDGIFSLLPARTH